MKLNYSKEQDEVVARFALAYDYLYFNGQIKNASTFTKKYGISYTSFNSIMKERKAKIFNVSWLVFLVRDYNINPMWLLTGVGKMTDSSDIMTLKKVKEIVDSALESHEES